MDKIQDKIVDLQWNQGKRGRFQTIAMQIFIDGMPFSETEPSRPSFKIGLSQDSTVLRNTP
jgi:hypothetical protein